MGDIKPDVDPARKDSIGDYDDFHGDHAADSRTRLAVPAMMLMIGATISMLGFLVIAVWGGYLLLFNKFRDEELMDVGAIFTAMGLAGAAYLAVIVIGAVRMRQFRQYQLARAAAILGVISIVFLQIFSVLVAPFAIWAIIVMRDPNVRREFRA